MDPQIQPTNASPVSMGVITGRVVDATDQTGLAQATIRVVDQQGNFMGDGVAAGNEGYFELNSPLLYGNLLEISHVAYNSVFVDPVGMAYYTVIPLQRDYEAMQAVTVTPRNNSANALPLLIGGAAILLFLKGKKK